MEQIQLITNIIEDDIGVDIGFDIEDDISIDIGFGIDNNISINDTIENSISLIDLKADINEINHDLNQMETIIELPIKKKKGRKSKKIKELELEQQQPKEPIIRFPKLSEKIFDVLKLDGVEYFYDTDFNLLLDINVVPVGFKYDKKFVFYSDTINNINQIKKDDKELEGLQYIFKKNII